MPSPSDEDGLIVAEVERGALEILRQVSPDGRWLSYTDWRMGNVMVRDLRTNTSRPVTANGRPFEFGSTQYSAISRDGESIAYQWYAGDSFELRVSDLRESAVPVPRTVWRSRDGRMTPFDWSPDGNWIAGAVGRDGRLAVGLLSVRDGTVREIRALPRGFPDVWKIVFSPDGRYVAFSEATERPGYSDIHVVSVDGARDVIVAGGTGENDVMGWSSDGHVVFVNNRTGRRSLWTIKVENGKAVAPARQAKDHVDSTWSVGLTESGTLHVWQRASASFVKIVGLDLDTGKLDVDEPRFERFIESRGRPTWSADGRHLLLMSCQWLGSGPCRLLLRSDEAREARELSRTIGVRFPQLSPDGRAILVRQGQAITVIDVATGAMTPAKEFQPGVEWSAPTWAPDGRSIRYQERRGDAVLIFERTLGTDQDREIVRTTPDGDVTVSLSPDDTLVVIQQEETERQTATLTVRPRSGGEQRVLLRLSKGSNFGTWQWTAGGRGLVVETREPNSAASSLWWVPISGTPRELEIDNRQWSETFAVSPDGRQIAFTEHAGEPGYTIWALENILPTDAVTSRR